MDVVPCADLIKNPEASAPYANISKIMQFQNDALIYGFCVDSLGKNTSIQADNPSGLVNSVNYTALHVFPCSLSTGCITTSLENLEVELSLPSSYTNMSSYELPIKNTITADQPVYSVNTLNQQKIYHNLV